MTIEEARTIDITRVPERYHDHGFHLGDGPALLDGGSG